MISLADLHANERTWGAGWLNGLAFQQKEITHGNVVRKTFRQLETSKTSSEELTVPRIRDTAGIQVLGGRATQRTQVVAGGNEAGSVSTKTMRNERWWSPSSGDFSDLHNPGVTSSSCSAARIDFLLHDRYSPVR